MKIRSTHALAFAAAALLVAACGGEAPPPETPPAPPPASPEPPAAPPPAESAQPATPPAPKPLKERTIGKWGFDFMASEPGKKAQEANKQKAGKDEKKLAELMQKATEEASKEWIEMTGDTYVSYVGDKAVYKAKYEVVKEDGNNLHVKQVGKDEISKKEMKDEIIVTLVDDNTLQMKDPKKGLLVFKRK